MCSARMTDSAARGSEPLCALFKTAPDYRFNITPVQLKPAAPALPGRWFFRCLELHGEFCGHLAAKRACVAIFS